jgi:peptidoglycan lytic transglycosylase
MMIDLLPDCSQHRKTAGRGGRAGENICGELSTSRLLPRLKQVRRSDNRSLMGVVSRRVVRFILVPASALVLCASQPISATTARSVVHGAADKTLLAQLLPFEHLKVVPIDPHQSFLEGYEAYRRRDFPSAIERMELAAQEFPELADYALYYLGSAERDNGSAQDAATAFLRLVDSYPQSVLADGAELEYARLELKLGQPALALAAVARVSARTADNQLEQHARLLEARARLASNDFRGAYGSAQALREKYPGGVTDSDARALAYSVLAAHPEVADTTSLGYHRSEAALLLREGLPAMALAEVRKALAMAPPPEARPEIAWLRAEALRGDPDQQAALLEYLSLAPAGTHAPAALNQLAHLFWHVDDTAHARTYFSRLVRDFPERSLAAQAMFEIGRTYEDDGDFSAARAEYLRLVSRYPDCEDATDARFRAPFMLYMLKRYDLAASGFASAKSHSASASQRDMLSYWEARALERSGENGRAHSILVSLATSIDSNYYPAIAAMRVNLEPEVFPAANAPQLVAVNVPAVSDAAEFHLVRAVALRKLGLRELENAELRALEENATGNPALRDFVLAEFQASGSWYDAIVAATRMASRGQINTLIAERLRYPRAFWNLVTTAAGRTDLDPYLLLALMRQESLFDPEACSVSDARGLMQLLPSTAQRYAVTVGMPSSPLDLYDPTLNVQLGTAYLRQLFTMFNDDTFKAVAAYNAGEHAVAGWVAKYPGDDDQWVENIGFRETREYVKKVIGGLREYRLLYRPHPERSPLSPARQSPG